MRLAQLGLAEPILWQAVLSGQRYAAECTLHDVASLGGILAWAKAHRMLRDQLAPLGWTVDNRQNYPTTVHPNKGWAIGVASGDQRTGHPDKTPATRTEKGPATRQAVSQNQLSFASISKEFERDASLRKTYLLLFHRDEDADEIRAELSLPAEMTGDGFVVEWQERIVLSVHPTSSSGLSVPTTDDGPDDSSDIDVPVTKKA